MIPIPSLRVFLALLLIGGLTGCATVDFDRSLARTNERAGQFTHGELHLARDAEQRDAMALRASELLSSPLNEQAAVQLALVNSPEFQSLLARNWARAADAAHAGTLGRLGMLRPTVETHFRWLREHRYIQGTRPAANLPAIYINAGRRGMLVRIDPKDMTRALRIAPVQVAIEQ